MFVWLFATYNQSLCGEKSYLEESTTILSCWRGRHGRATNVHPIKHRNVVYTYSCITGTDVAAAVGCAACDWVKGDAKYAAALEERS